MTTYESDIMLGEKYQDTQTALVGVATALHFYQYACERVTLETISPKTGELQEHGFDAPRLRHVDALSRPVEQRKPGGPERHGETRSAPRR